jgi:thiamine-phosphate diphosphorylase
MKNISCNQLRKAMLLYAVTDRSWLKNGETLYEACEKAIRGGITLLQLREKNLSTEDFIKEGLQIKKLCHDNNVMLIINDDVDAMLALDADGLHIGQDDGDVREIREKIGKDKILGVSSRTVEESLKAIEDGADYLGIGAVFSTSTKLDAVDVSFKTLKEITKISSVPTCAIGGISLHNIDELANSGINGCAIVSAIFKSDDVEKSTRILREKCDKVFFKYNASNYIFDLDGTLIDSLGIWENLASSYLKDKKIIAEEDLDKKIANFSLDESAHYLKENYDLNENEEEIKRQVIKKIYDFYSNSVKPKSGVKDYLDNVFNKGITLSIASASSKSLVEAALKNNKIDGYFTIIKTEEEVGFSKAKSSCIYDEIITELNTSKGDVVVFEDSYAAIQTLKKNNYYTIGIYDKHSQEDVSEICDYYIKSFKDY